jgi:hypothetical protein
MVKKPNTGMEGSFLDISSCRPDTTRLVLVPMSAVGGQGLGECVLVRGGSRPL